MIRKLFHRVFRRGSVLSPGNSVKNAALIPLARHGIHRESVSPGARRTCEVLQKKVLRPMLSVVQCVI